VTLRRGPTELPATWGELNAPVEQSVEVDGVTLRPGSRVRLHPRTGGDVLDLALAGQVAVVEGVDQDHDGDLHLAVTLEIDPGRDLGESRIPGHRFFFTPAEVEPLPDEAGGAASPGAGMSPRVLVAGIGNVFLGDDGFGVEVVRRLTERWTGRPPAPGVDVVDFGIRGMDLVYALGRGYDAAILVDAAPRGEAPGTVSVVEPELHGEIATIETHGMDPVKVLAMARASGPLPGIVRLVVCEPQEMLATEDWHDARMELSARVEAAVDPAVATVESLVRELRAEIAGSERYEAATAGAVGEERS
jgi:hydrogenase maturation protease